MTERECMCVSVCVSVLWGCILDGGGGVVRINHQCTTYVSQVLLSYDRRLHALSMRYYE